jgi:hypothetical protein
VERCYDSAPEEEMKSFLSRAAVGDKPVEVMVVELKHEN